MDVGHRLDHGPWSRTQKFVLALMALTILFDGFDLLVLSFAIPALMKDWDVPRSGFAGVLALGLVAMSLGTAIAGHLGDRLGRKRALVLSVAVFGSATLATAFATGLASLGVLRAIAGAGLGGAVPNAAAMSAEFTPLIRRPLAVSLTAVCMALGGAVAGFCAARVLPVFGWPYLFALGGVAALLLALCLGAALPESARFLVRRRHRWPELRRLLARMGAPAEDAVEFTDQAETARETHSGWRALLAGGMARNTVALWTSFTSCMLAVYLALNWLPSFLAARGWTLAQASNGAALYNFGGVAGALVCAALVPRFGSRAALMAVCAGGIGSAIWLLNGPVSAAMLAAHGLFVNAAMSNLYALAAHVYPTAARASGVAAAIALGRLGAVASAYWGADLVQRGPEAYFGAIAAALLVTFTGLVFTTRHIPARRAQNSSNGSPV